MVLMFQEKERLQAMMTHLHLNKKKVKIFCTEDLWTLNFCSKEEERKITDQRENGFSNRTPEPESNKPQNLPKPLGFGPPLHGLGFPPNLGGLGGFPGPRPPGFGFLPPGGGSQGGMPGPIRRRITDKTPMSLPSGQDDDVTPLLYLTQGRFVGNFGQNLHLAD